MLKVAVTGASGHIGNCLVHELIKSGAHVKVLVHRHENNLEDPAVEIIYGNILDPVSLKTFCKDTDVVYHCAGLISIDNRHKRLVYETNVTGTGNMVEASLASGVQKFIHFSSIDAFRKIDGEQVLNEAIPLTENKNSVYGFSKAESEKVVLEAVGKGLDAVILSPAAVVGPYDFKKSYLGSALLKLYKNKIPVLIPAGYNWVDVRDVASAAIQSVNKGRKGEKYILAGNFCTLKGMAEIIGKISGNKSARWVVPVFLARLACPVFDLHYLIAKRKPMITCQSLKILIHAPRNISFDKAKKDLGYFPRPLEKTLSDTFEWHKKNGCL